MITRADFVRGSMAALCAAALTRSAIAVGDYETMQTRKIPSSGKSLPVIGLGTWQVFDVGASAAERTPLAQVVETLFAGGGSVIDSSPMYGKAEGVAGDILETAKTRNKAFIATKVWTRGKAEGIAQMERSFALFKTKHIDLMQVHNLVDSDTHLTTLKGWKADGRISYLGVTHYTPSAFGELEAVMRREKLDFVQFDYALDDRAAEKTLLPLALERGIAVLVNKPFGGGGLLRSLKGRALPDWAGEIGCTSWAQILLKFVLSNPAVTCAIPGTANPQHMKDNMLAGIGALPDASLRAKMIAAIR